MGQRGVPHQKACNDGPVKRRQWRKPQRLPRAVKGRAIAIRQMMTDVAMRAALARLCRKGIFAVRMMWMMSVCVSSDSTNQPV